jgi:glycosyltransferase involved in cell wall biosynthesis
MRIGYDVSQTAEEKAGCGFFADQIIRSLLKMDKINEYILYPTFYSYRNPSFAQATKIEAKNCHPHFKGMSFHAMVHMWEIKMEDRTEWLGSPDIVHSNNFSCIKDHKAKIVFTIYDVAPMVYPEFTTEENRVICFDGLFSASLYADHCIAISEYTKKSFLHYFPHYPEKRITVVHLGTRESLISNMNADLKVKVLKKFDIAGEFWLGVGTIEPRKNYRLLIEAYSELIDQKRPLVIAGGKGWLESDLGQRIKQSGIKERVKFLGYVTDEELSVLYSSCFAFIYPSFYEGFGLPVLEAMSCGAAVITSNTSSLPEVGAEAVLYIDPWSKESLVEKMKLLMDHPLLIQELRKKSKERSKMFSWNKAAERVLQVHKMAMETKSWFI